MSMCIGSLHSKSSLQKLNAKISTEVEIVYLDDEFHECARI